MMKEAIESNEGDKFKNDYLNNEILDYKLMEKLISAARNLESHFKGVVIEGFPNNMS